MIAPFFVFWQIACSSTDSSAFCCILRVDIVARRLKVLWLSPGFLHPTNRGGQIRTLEILRHLHLRHEIHFLGLHDGTSEAIQKSGEYCSKVWPVPYILAPKNSAKFLVQSLRGFVSREPVVVARKQSPEMRQLARQLLKQHSYDRVVCDFLTSTINLPPSEPFILFEHNVETQIWQRYAEGAGPKRRWYFLRQAECVREFERAACVRASRVIAVSKADAELLGELHGISNVDVVPTGVDAAYFAKPSTITREAGSGLVFCGSMDWRPNVDGILWFVREVLPIIQRQQPSCTLTIVGRKPEPAIRQLAAKNSLIRVTSTVDDVRPYLWAGRVSIVPLHSGSGTRLKIYESMASEVPVVSTTVGAEGLEVMSPHNIRIADTAESFAEACLVLLENDAEHKRQARAAEQLVRERFSWRQAADRFDEILQS